MVGRVGQAGDRLGPVEAGVDRAERAGRLALGAGEQRGEVERELDWVALGVALAAGRDRDRLTGVGVELGVALVHRPGRDQAEADPAGVEGLESVDGAQEVGVEGRDRAGDDLLDEHLVA